MIKLTLILVLVAISIIPSYGYSIFTKGLVEDDKTCTKCKEDVGKILNLFEDPLFNGALIFVILLQSLFGRIAKSPVHDIIELISGAVFALLSFMLFGLLAIFNDSGAPTSILVEDVLEIDAMILGVGEIISLLAHVSPAKICEFIRKCQA